MKFLFPLEQVIELHNKQGVFHPLTATTKTDHSGRNYLAWSSGGNYPIVGDLRFNGCVAYPDIKKNN